MQCCTCYSSASTQRPAKRQRRADLTGRRYHSITSKLTVTCATDGNHGRSVAWGARTFGCRCVIYVHATVSEGRCRAIAAYGAEVRRVPGTFDDAVRRADADAVKNGWHVVSDTSYEGYTDIPRDVMQGYSLMVNEALAQAAVISNPRVCARRRRGIRQPGICSYLWEKYGSARPHYVVVEPDKRIASTAAPLPASRRPPRGPTRHHHGGSCLRGSFDPGLAHSGCRQRCVHNN